MKAVGIIAEYNPLHNGHIYHIEEARRLAGSDAVVVAMSGNYVQRGEPAILDKWTRSRHAISHGADLVVEIPCLLSLGNAGQYAKAGVALLEGLGAVDTIAFGSECGDAKALKRVADNLADARHEIKELLLKYSKTGLSYPAARENAYRSIYESSNYLNQDIEVLSSSNDILALEYISSLKSAQPLPIKRKGCGYNSKIDNDAEFQSASAIRQLVKEGREFGDYLPGDVEVDLMKSICNYDSKWFELVRYAVISTDADDIDNCPSGGEGLGNKLKHCIREASNLDELILDVKSKKYTYSRISRLCAQLVIGISNNEFKDVLPQYIRILAFNDKGRELLSEIKKSELNTLPIITNIARESGKLDEKALALLELEAKGSDIYNTICSHNLNMHSDYRQNPVKQIKSDDK